MAVELNAGELHLVTAYRRGRLRLLKPRGLTIYLALIGQLGEAPGGAFIRAEDLAEVSASSLSTVYRGGAECHALGLIERQWHSKERGSYYRLIF
ncbi:MAG: hypothetical protein KF768_13480 [Phycisphaeraceae bacterium]|nr:hypothetical protein [Phycisphaeraceae bacterium]